MWRWEHFKLFDASLNNHFEVIFLIFYILVAKMINSIVDNVTIMVISMVIITHNEPTEMMIFFIYDFGTNPEWVKYARFS